MKVTAIIVAVIIIYLSTNVFIVTNNPRANTNHNPKMPENLNASKFLELHLLKAHIHQAMPIVKVANKEQESTSWLKGIKQLTLWITGFDVGQPKTILANQMLTLQYHQPTVSTWAEKISDDEEVESETVFASIDTDMLTQPVLPAEGRRVDGSEDVRPSDIKNTQNVEKEDRQFSVDEFNLVPVRQRGQSSGARIFVNNETDLNLDIENLLNQKLSVDLSQKGPKVLIMHTHTSEAYTTTAQNHYIPTDPDRTEDPRYNVVRVGEELAKHLQKLGVEVIHDKTIHDYPSYNGSYQSALQTIQAQLQKHPSIRFVLDVHRDALLFDNDQKLYVATEIRGNKAAQIMFVVGTNQWGLTHPYWKENFKLALKLQQKSSELYPGFARPILLTKYRYNQHLTTGSLIIEVGAHGNTLEEALVSTEYLADVLAQVIK